LVLEDASLDRPALRNTLTLEKIMNRSTLRNVSVLLLGLPFVLTACAGSANVSQRGGAGVLPETAPQVARNVGSESVPHVAGTYEGSYSETIGDRTVNGTVTIVIDQSGSKISGKFDVDEKGAKFPFGLKGSVRSAPHGARLRFLITQPDNRDAHARASLIGKVLKGKALAPATKSQEAVHIKFDTKET
jgi:hypothetical protein